MEKIDFKRIGIILLSQCPGILYSWFPNGKLDGREFKIGNISGEAGDSLCVNTQTGVWKDFAGDIGGADLISLYAAKEGKKMGEAARILDNGEIAPESKKKEKKFIPLEIVPENAGLPPQHFKNGAYNLHWEYRSKTGELLGVTCRFDFSDGTKDVLPARWINGRWAWKSFPQPRILYGLETLKDGPLVIVEGEKKADSLRRLLPNHSVVGWPGGAGAAKLADWNLIKDYSDITIWPDNDAAGRKAATEIRKILGRGYVIETKGDDGWDAADAEKEGWDAARTLDFISPLIPEYETREDEYLQQKPFKVLGYDGDEFFFYSYKSKQVIGTSKGSLSNSASLLQLAPLSWWIMNGYTTDKENLRTTQAVDMLISNCFEVGLFHPNLCRGAGAWDDNGRSVLHVGDKLIVNGMEIELSDFDSKFIYERRHSTGIEYGKPLGTLEANKLLKMCELIRWEDSISASLLAGWIIIAPICGALLHRPHLYIIGPATSGKSWVIERIIQGVLGKTAFVTSSKTTAAGIRQNMRSDALPVIFDEAEAENLQDRERLQQVFDLARVSFNGDAAPIHKGTSDQIGRAYSPRSCFCFGSINQSMTRNPDETRTSVLKIRQPNRKNEELERQNFTALEKMETETITPEWRGGLLSRTVKLIPIIKKNSKIFADAASVYFSSRRQGDQLGAILAGLFSLYKTRVVTPMEALDFISRQSWTQQKEVNEDSSHIRLWRFLMESIVEYDSMGAGNKKATVSELIAVLAHDIDAIQCSEAVAERALRNSGFRVKDGMILVSNTAIWIDNRLKNTEWPGKWANALKCLDGAVASKTSERFITISKYVSIPIHLK